MLNHALSGGVRLSSALASQVGRRAQNICVPVTDLQLVVSVSNSPPLLTLPSFEVSDCGNTVESVQCLVCRAVLVRCSSDEVRTSGREALDADAAAACASVILAAHCRHRQTQTCSKLTHQQGILAGKKPSIDSASSADSPSPRILSPPRSREFVISVPVLILTPNTKLNYRAFSCSSRCRATSATFGTTTRETANLVPNRSVRVPNSHNEWRKLISSRQAQDLSLRRHRERPALKTPPFLRQWQAVCWRQYPRHRSFRS